MHVHAWYMTSEFSTELMLSVNVLNAIFLQPKGKTKNMRDSLHLHGTRPVQSFSVELNIFLRG